MIRHRENGLLGDVGNADALAAGVVEIVRNEVLGRQLARNARSWAEQFSWHRVFPQLMQCYGFDAEREVSPAADQILVH
jgi:glycosyltransferase involved in cell wall biosynthesis